MRLSNQFRNLYEDLWTSAPAEPSDVIKRGFDYIDCEFQSDSLLFVGINPSCNKMTAKPEDIDKPDRCASMKTHPYFLALQQVATNCGFKDMWYVLDVLAIRSPSLKEIKDAVALHPDFKDFCIKQFLIFKDIAREVRPKAIVVCNAYAREWINDKTFNCEAFDFDIFDEEIGTKRIINDAVLNQVPVFFSGMFSGGHQVDRGSRERLEWQIRRAKKALLL